MRERGRPELLKREQESGVFTTVAAVLAVLFLTVVFVGVWFRETYTAYRIEKESMQNTLFDGDIVYAERGAKADRGDIVILDVSGRTAFADDTIIKRLIAVEGDAVMCKDGAIYLRYAGTDEFVRPSEPYAVGSCEDFSVCVIPKGQIFVLGDNRGPSRDSSEVGPLRASEIVAVVPQWSIDRKESIKNWEGFRDSVRDFFYHLFH